jgi:hypothetical protein
VIRYKAKYDNPTQDGSKTGEQLAKVHLVRARSLKPPVYLDPCLGPAAFFSKIEVRIKDTKMNAAQLEEFGYIYQSLNRRFMTQDAQMERYGKTFPRINTTAKRVAADTSLMVEDLKKAAATLNFDNWDNDISLSVRFGMDGRFLTLFPFARDSPSLLIPGVFPFNNQSNILATLLGKLIPQGFLRPSTEIYVDLFKRQPMDACIDSSKTKDASYFADEAADTDKPAIKIELQDLSIMYESVVPTPAILHSLARGSKSYYVDVPKINHRELSDGLRYVKCDMPIDEGTKAIIAFFVHEKQLVFDPASKRNLHARMKFPANCTEMRLKLTGRDNFLIHEGLVNPGLPAKCSLEAANQTYHWMLCKQGLYDDVLDSMFPRSAVTNSYDQVLILNTSCFKLKEPVVLSVTMSFDEKGSPPKHRMVVLTLQQYLFTQAEAGTWKFEVQI